MPPIYGLDIRMNYNNKFNSIQQKLRQERGGTPSKNILILNFNKKLIIRTIKIKKFINHFNMFVKLSRNYLLFNFINIDFNQSDYYI